MIATDLNREKLEELKREEPSVTTDVLDVTRKADVEHLLKEKYSDVNVLFNCAGYTKTSSPPCVLYSYS